jgi:hypothetical protein
MNPDLEEYEKLASSEYLISSNFNEYFKKKQEISDKLDSIPMLHKQLHKWRKQTKFYRDKYYGTIPDNYTHIKREDWNNVLNEKQILKSGLEEILKSDLPISVGIKDEIKELLERIK